MSGTLTSPCPFCGDVRPASVEEIAMKYDPPNLFAANCQCCGAQGPTATTRGIALVLWDERRQPGEAEAFCRKVERLGS